MRGDVYWAKLPEAVGCETFGDRPVVIVSCDPLNAHAGIVEAVCLTGRVKRPDLPTHAVLTVEDGVPMTATALCEQIRTLDKSRLGERIGHLTDEALRRVDDALREALALRRSP